MKKRNAITLIAMIVMAIGVIFCGTAVAQQEFFEKGFSTPAGPKYVPGEIIVKFKPGVNDEVIGEINRKHGCSVLSTSRFARFKRLRIPRGRTVDEMVATYKVNPNVKYAEPNHIAHAFWVPDDPLYPYQWHLDNDDYGGINMESAWGISTGLGVIVAVIDTGVAYEDYEEFVDNPGRGRDYWITYAQAPDLDETNFEPGYDFVNGDIHPNDDEGHGTHVTGTIAQTTDNNLGVAGVAFDCTIMPVKVLDSTGSGTYFDVAEGILFAADNGAQVINMSLGGSLPSDTLENAVKYAYDAGVTIVCASGNDGSATTISYPAAYDAYCIAVGATRYDETVCWYSNGGDSLDLTAPGGDLGVDQNGDGYGDGVLQQTHDGSDFTNFGYWFYQGTSMAAPHVAGVAALLIANGVTGPDNVREALQSTAEDKGPVGRDDAYGYGIVDAYAALNYAAGPDITEPVLSITAVPDPSDGPTTITVSSNEELSAAPTVEVALPDTTTASLEMSVTTVTNTWDGTFIVNQTGTHTIEASGTDLAGNKGTATITFQGDVSAPIISAVACSGITSTTATITWTTDEFSDSVVIYGATTPPSSTASDGTMVTDHSITLTGLTADTLYCYEVESTDVAGNTATDNSGGAYYSFTTTAAPLNVMHVASIDMTSTRIRLNGWYTYATATVSIVDADGNPVQGATVSGSWSGLTSDTDSGVTDSNGQVALDSNAVKNAEGTFTFTVDNVDLTGWTYDPTANVETSGSITVN